MRHRNIRRVALLFLCSIGMLGGCSNTTNKPRPATFDADMRMEGETREFYSQHRVVTLNEHDFHKRRRAEIRDQRIDCLYRECKLQPGWHSVDIEYFWSSIEAENRRDRKLGLEGVLLLLGILGGAAGDLPDNSRYFPCRASVSFEVQSGHEYALKVVHTDQSEEPENIQMVDIESGAVVGSAQPSCR